MTRVFIDANVFFAAVKSHSGGSYFIIELFKQHTHEIEAVTVLHALAEAERNIEQKIGITALQEHYDNLLMMRPAIQSLRSIPKGLEESLKKYVPEKDVPILAGALLSDAEVLITLDRKHLLKNKSLSGVNLPFRIMTPGDFILEYLTR